ncbi:MAG: succinate dehydrogenase assembly factor 2 [Gemmatimonadetes bacterium]|nr:succinate dehydrogenase assembly factor 2 [Gemmatimonadota bacterium]
MGATASEIPIAVDADARELSRLRWRCRRGMRELDELLLRYLEHRLPQATPRERDAFACLLELPDPELFGYLAGHRPRHAAADPTLEYVIARIRSNEP